MEKIEAQGIRRHRPAATGGEMDVEHVRHRVRLIKAMKNDDERAHRNEDALHWAVLCAISDGAVNAQQLAGEALKTGAIEFARGCAPCSE